MTFNLDCEYGHTLVSGANRYPARIVDTSCRVDYPILAIVEYADGSRGVRSFDAKGSSASGYLCDNPPPAPKIVSTRTKTITVTQTKFDDGSIEYVSTDGKRTQTKRYSKDGITVKFDPALPEEFVSKMWYMV